MAISYYEFQPGEAGTLVEIYLPAKYEAVLREIMKSALNYNRVLMFFPDQLDAALRRLLPQQIIEKYPDLLARMRQREFEGVYFGFSVFTVDGTFSGTTDVYHERTTVARVILRPNYFALSALADEHHIREIAKLFFRSGQRPEQFKNQPKWENNSWQPLNDTDKKIVDAFGAWQDLGALFVYGFIIRRVTEIPEIQEEQIWVTSYHNPVVNVIKSAGLAE